MRGLPKDRPWWAPEIEGVLAFLSLCIFAGVTGIVLFSLIPEKNEKYAMLLLGALIGIVKDTFARYFQVTKGGTELRNTIDTMAQASRDVAAVAAASTPAAGTATVTPAADVSVEMRK